MISYKSFILKIIITQLLFITPLLIQAQIVLEANGIGDTYELINSILAPNGGDVVESAECAHPEFGRHIAEVWDDELKQWVFEFYIHVAEDNDRCINFDRQRVEIKTYDSSPANLKGIQGETITYKWRFKIPTGFQPSSSFTHIHQIKAVGGDESDPLFVLTARKGTPNKLELNYYKSSELSSVKYANVNLSLFENTWVEAIERIGVNEVAGTYSITIKKVSDGTTLLSYTNNNILTFRSDNTFIRPKWGIYRSLNSPSDLRDETLRFSMFSIYEEPKTLTENVFENENIFSFRQLDSNSAIFDYSITEDKNVKIDLFNSNGQLVYTSGKNQFKTEGKHELKISTNNLNSGLYFAFFSSGNKSITKKIIIAK